MQNTNTRTRLRELHGSGYEIVDGQPNIIGWTIKDNNGHRIGVVSDLLFDEDQQKVRYMIANMKDNHFNLDKRKVLIPIGIAELHETNDDVLVPSISAWQLRALPTYTGGITDQDEHEVYSVFSAQGATANMGNTPWQKPQNFYEHDHFNHDRMYKRRSASLEDKPMQRSFRRRENADTTSLNTEGRGDYATSRTLHDNDAIAAGNQQHSPDMSERGSMGNDEHERLINKIRRMHSELDELERDIRNTRGA